jgi:hypothetical protein
VFSSRSGNSVTGSQAASSSSYSPANSSAVVAHQHELLDGVDAALDVLEQGQQLGVDQQDVVFGMAHGVDELLGRQADVHGMQHGADHGHGVEALEETVTVPVHHGDRVARSDAQVAQRRRQAAHPLAELPVGEAQLAAVDDLLVGIVHQRGRQHVLDEQRKVVGRVGAPDQIAHVSSPGSVTRRYGIRPVPASRRQVGRVPASRRRVPGGPLRRSRAATRL